MRQELGKDFLTKEKKENSGTQRGRSKCTLVPAEIKPRVIRKIQV